MSERRTSAAGTGRFVCETAGDRADASLSLDPRKWSEGDVVGWLEESQRSLELLPINMTRFRTMNGSALCKLTVDQFLSIEPLYGDILYEHLKATINRA